jgi:hypothetical protein
MHVTLDNFEIDPSDPHDNDFIKWYDANRHLTKHMVRVGYYVIRDGIEGCIRRDAFDIEKEIETLKRRHDEELINEKAKHARIIRETHAIYEDTLKQIKESVNVADVRHIMEQEYASRMALASLQAEQEIEKKYTRELFELRESSHNYKRMYDDMLSKYEEIKCESIKHEENIKTRLQSEHDSKVALAVLKAEKEIMDKINDTLVTIKAEADKYKALYLDVKCRYDEGLQNLVDNEKDRKILELESTVACNERELCILKKTNFAKGNKGESLILNFLRDSFPQYEYHDVSKEKHDD